MRKLCEHTITSLDFYAMNFEIVVRVMGLCQEDYPYVKC